MAIRALAVLVLSVRLAAAAPPALETQTVDKVSVGLPKGWKVTTSAAAATIFVAQLDAARADAPAMIVSIQATGNTTSEDQLLDFVAGQVAKDLVVAHREAIPGGGHMMIANGTAGGIAVRIAAVALAPGSAAILAVLVGKPADFDALGGIALVGQVITTIKMPTPPAPAPAPTPAPTSGNKLDTPPARPLTIADLAGTWTEDSGAIQGYVNGSGGYAGYTAVQTASSYEITAKGDVTMKLRAVATGTGGGAARLTDQTTAHKLTVSPNGVIELTNPGHTSTIYVVRGWYVTPELTVLNLAGQFWTSAPADVIADPKKGPHEIWVRKNPRP